MAGSTKRTQVLGLPVDTLSREEACDHLFAFLEGEQRTGSNTLHVVTMNAEMAMQALNDHELGAIIGRAGLVTPDGVGIVWAVRRRGQVPNIEKVAGIELVQTLVARAAQTGHRIYLLGGKPGVPEEAARALQQTYPGLQITGLRHGYFGPDEETEILANIKEARPDILLVALGVPRQEKWIDRHQADLRVPITIGVGGSLDVFAGRVRRAPDAFQRLHLEWLYRLLQEPWRLKRMRTTLPAFVYRVLTEPPVLPHAKDHP